MRSPTGAPSKFFSERERAALAYADTMTRDITVPDAVFAEVKRHFDDAGDRGIDRARSAPTI